MVSSLKGYIQGGGGRLKDGGRNSSSWWQMISYVHKGVGVGNGSWFEDNLRRVVRGGSITFFFGLVIG